MSRCPGSPALAAAQDTEFARLKVTRDSMLPVESGVQDAAEAYVSDSILTSKNPMIFRPLLIKVLTQCLRPIVQCLRNLKSVEPMLTAGMNRILVPDFTPTYTPQEVVTPDSLDGVRCRL